MDLEMLAKRCEEAAEGSIAIERAIAIGLGWREIHNPTGLLEMAPPGTSESRHWRRPPEWSRSVDAALGLVPDGDGFMLRYHEVASGGLRATASILGTRPHGDTWDKSAATPALALCAAALRARAAMTPA